MASWSVPHRRDMFSPTINVVFHHYSRARSHSVFGEHDSANWTAQQQAAHAKALHLLGELHVVVTKL